MSNRSTNRLSSAKLLKAGGAAILAAVIVNILIRLILAVIIPLAQDFVPFAFGSIIIFSIIFTLIGVGVLALVNRLVTNTMKVYNIIGIAALVISILPNLAGSANPAAIPMGGEGANYLILIIFHITGAAGFLGTLNYFTRQG